VANVIDIEKALKKIKAYYDETKTIEFHFLKNFGINLVLEDDAIDHIIENFISTAASADHIYKQLAADFEYGLKLVRDKTGRNRFFVTKEALENPENYISRLLKQETRPNRLEVE
jgi:hypothetical protein